MFKKLHFVKEKIINKKLGLVGPIGFGNVRSSAVGFNWFWLCRVGSSWVMLDPFGSSWVWLGPHGSYLVLFGLVWSCWVMSG